MKSLELKCGPNFPNCELQYGKVQNSVSDISSGTYDNTTLSTC